MNGSLRAAAIAIVLSVAISAVCVADPGGEPFIGEYEGVCHLLGYPDLPASATVVTEGPGLYRAMLQFTRPAPASRQEFIEIHGQLAGTRVVFSGVSQSVWWKGELADDKLTLERTDHYGIDLVLRAVSRTSPTEGQAPPEGAVVLIPFTPGTPPDMSAWVDSKWEPQPDGSVQVKPRAGSITSKESFGSCRLHIEFNLPHMPNEQGQGRANSGLYVQNRYEVQVLDSFGTLSGAGDCGALYQVEAARVNASLPPGRWQTYDIVYHAPKYDADGKVKENARMTVEHNGVKIHDETELPNECPGGMPVANGQDRGPMHLQDHGNPVRFRNFWVLPINDR